VKRVLGGMGNRGDLLDRRERERAISQLGGGGSRRSKQPYIDFIDVRRPYE